MDAAFEYLYVCREDGFHFNYHYSLRDDTLALRKERLSQTSRDREEVESVSVCLRDVRLQDIVVQKTFVRSRSLIAAIALMFIVVLPLCYAWNDSRHDRASQIAGVASMAVIVLLFIGLPRTQVIRWVMIGTPARVPLVIHNRFEDEFDRERFERFLFTVLNRLKGEAGPTSPPSQPR